MLYSEWILLYHAKYASWCFILAVSYIHTRKVLIVLGGTLFAMSGGMLHEQRQAFIPAAAAAGRLGGIGYFGAGASHPGPKVDQSQARPNDHLVGN